MPATKEYFHVYGEGLNDNCKVCKNEMVKKHYQENRESILKKKKKYRKKNRDWILEKQRNRNEKIKNANNLYIRDMKEEKLQSICFRWFNNEHPNLRGCMWHVPNGGSRDMREAVKLKATGVIAGVWDLHFIHNGKLHIIEMKVGKGKLSKEQIWWESQVTKQGAISHPPVYNFEDFKNLINKIFLSE